MTLIALITIQIIPLISLVQTENLSCFMYTTDGVFDPKINSKITTVVPELEDFRKSDILQLTPEENKQFEFDAFNRYPDNATILFIITPDGINKEQGFPLMNFVNNQQNFHGIKQINHMGEIKLDAVQIQYQKWIEAHQTCKHRLIDPLLEEDLFCEDFEDVIDDLVKTWMKQTLASAISLKQNIVWIDAMKDDAFFAKILKKVRKGQYQMKFIFVVGDKTTVISEAEIESRRAMMKYDKSQYYTSLRLIDDLASDLRENEMSEDMLCTMSNGDDAPIEEIDYDEMKRFIKSYTKATINRRVRSWFSKVGTGIARKFRTDAETQLEKKRKQDDQSRLADQDATPGVIKFKNIGKSVINDSDSSDSGNSGVESIGSTTGFAFWFGLAIVTVFMSLFGVIL